MKYAVRIDMPGLTEDQYAKQNAILGPKSRAYPEAIVHMAGPTDGGWFMFEVWESREAFLRFMEQEVAPLMPPDAPMPSIQEFTIHTFDLVH